LRSGSTAIRSSVIAAYSPCGGIGDAAPSLAADSTAQGMGT
jgi:hypothetical protein